MNYLHLLISGDKWETRKRQMYNQHKASLGPNKVDRIRFIRRMLLFNSQARCPHSSVTLNLFSNECCLLWVSFLLLLSPCSDFRVHICSSGKGDVSLAFIQKREGINFGSKCLMLVLYPLSSVPERSVVVLLYFIAIRYIKSTESW